jgi:GT2 family glycosyltransferase
MVREEPPPEDPRSLARRLAYTEERLNETRAELYALTNSAGYRIVGRVRRFLRTIAPPDTARGALLASLLRGVDLIQTQGFRPFWRQLLRPGEWSRPFVAHLRDPGGSDQARYQRLLERRRAAASTSGDTGVSFDIVLACRDPHQGWFRRALQSIAGQTYSQWRLILIDDASRQAASAALEAVPGLAARTLVLRRDVSSVDGAFGDAAPHLSADFVCFAGQHDLLDRDALAELAAAVAETGADVVYSDEDRIVSDGERERPFFKPDWSPDLLPNANFVGSIVAVRREVALRAGLPAGPLGEHDFLLCCAGLSDRFAHVAAPLYSRRLLLPDERVRFIDNPYEVRPEPQVRNLRPALTAEPRVTIIIPTRDRLDLLRACLASIETRTTYANREVLIVDNDSSEAATLEFLAACGYRVLKHPGRFNFAAICNAAARTCDSAAVLFLNNDTEVVAPDWIEAMLEQLQRPGVGIVGARLLNYDGSIQHDGIVLGLNGAFSGHISSAADPYLAGAVRNVSAVTAACMLVRRDVYQALDGMDERLSVGWNDVDLCLRAWRAGFRVVIQPLAELYHQGGASRGFGQPIEDDMRFEALWGKPGRMRDAYYNPNFDLAAPYRIRA